MLYAIFGGNLSFTQLLFMLFSYAVLILVMMPVHEFAHAYTAVKLGDYTPRANGRLTLNPLAHIDPIGSLLILVVGFGYAKPVPVNPYNFRDRKKGMALTAVMGPLSNLAMAIVSVALFSVLWRLSGTHDPAFWVNNTNAGKDVWLVLITVFAYVNLALAIFNLIPIPPLDGFRIFGAVLPDRWTRWVDANFWLVQMALMLLIFMGFLSGPLSALIRLIGNAIAFLFGVPGIFGQ